MYNFTTYLKRVDILTEDKILVFYISRLHKSLCRLSRVFRIDKYMVKQRNEGATEQPYNMTGVLKEGRFNSLG